MLCQVVAMPTELYISWLGGRFQKHVTLFYDQSDVQAFELNLQFALLFLAGFN